MPFSPCHPSYISIPQQPKLPAPDILFTAGNFEPTCLSAPLSFIRMMTTREQTFAAAARSCALLLLLLLLLLAAYFPAARSSAETDVAGCQESTSTPATEDVNGRTATTVSTSELDVTRISIDGEFRRLEDLEECSGECFEVCCWQGDPVCPYPCCNYNQGACSGG